MNVTKSTNELIDHWFLTPRQPFRFHCGEYCSQFTWLLYTTVQTFHHRILNDRSDSFLFFHPNLSPKLSMYTLHRANRKKLETITSFKYLGSVTTDEGSKSEMLSRIAQATAALTRMKPVWNDRSISLSSKIRLMHPLVTFIFLYACEPWILTAELQRRIQAMEMRCYHKILRISYKDDRKETQTAMV